MNSGDLMPDYFQSVKILFVLVMMVAASDSYSVEVKNWSFKGHKNWTQLHGRNIPVDYAEASVSDEKLAVLYDKQDRQWYLQFTYIGKRQLTHSKNKQPEFFVRTLKNAGSGRFDSDYVIKGEAKVFFNDPGKPQYLIMKVAPSDLPYLKVGLDIGAGYYLTDKCSSFIEGGRCIDFGEFRTYLFPGANITKAISEIERRNGLSVSKPISMKQRKAEFSQQKSNAKIAKIIQWYEGDWAEVISSGPVFGGCDRLRKIDYDRFPNLMQKGRFLGSKFQGILAISALGATSHDHIYVSSAYSKDSWNEGLVQGLEGTETKKISVFVEDGKEFTRLRLGDEIRGISYKRIIETDGETLRLIAWDTGGKKVRPLYFIRCK